MDRRQFFKSSVHAGIAVAAIGTCRYQSSKAKVAGAETGFSVTTGYKILNDGKIGMLSETGNLDLSGERAWAKPIIERIKEKFSYMSPTFSFDYLASDDESKPATALFVRGWGDRYLQFFVECGRTDDVFVDNSMRVLNSLVIDDIWNNDGRFQTYPHK